MRQFTINELKAELIRRELSNVPDDGIHDLIFIEEMKNVVKKGLGYVPNEIIDVIERCYRDIKCVRVDKHWFDKKVVIEFKNFTVKEYYIDNICGVYRIC